MGALGEDILKSTSATPSAEGTDGAGDNLIHKELHIRAPPGGALAYAGQADVWRTATQVEAAKDAADNLSAASNLAGTAIAGTIDARFEVVRWADKN